MARAINRLTARGLEALDDPGLHADGAGLYLRIDQTGAKRWVYVFFWRGRRREMGLGSASPGGVALKDARTEAAEARRKVGQGIDPIADRKVIDSSSITFGAFAQDVIAEMDDGWRNPKSAEQWTASLKTHAPMIWRKPIADVDTDDVLDALRPIWTKLPETARRLRGRIETILDHARIKTLRTGENPARRRGHLQILLPKQPKSHGHHTALPYEDTPAFMTLVRAREAMAARAMEFAILAAGRTTEVREATWPEVLGRAKSWPEATGDLWIIPPERMKGDEEHQVPITDPMRTILDALWPLRVADDGYIFPGDQRIEPLSRMAMLMLLRRMEVEATVHGFRSTFSDWAHDCTDHPHEVIEQCLAHKVGTKSAQAYRRRKAVAKRRALMEDWAGFCAKPASNVVIFRA